MGIRGIKTLNENTPRPSLNGEPIVLIHFEYPEGSGLAACCGEPFNQPTDEVKNYPVVLCEGCRRSSYKVM